jgi:hypothetical protein
MARRTQAIILVFSNGHSTESRWYDKIFSATLFFKIDGYFTGYQHLRQLFFSDLK